ncbi:transposase family protein [Streptomyces inhibens]|uniref:transposase family protein n=1 Tax=Streptomyces inhibens TaxID=2293571 RepID=UPI0036B9280C
MAGVITALEPSWTAPFAGLSPRCFRKLVTALRREGAEAVRRGRPWSLPLEDRFLLVAAYWRTNLTLRQLAPLFGVSKSMADRVINHLGPLPARLVVVAGRPLPGNRNDGKAWELPGARGTVGNATVIADGGCRGTGLVVPHRRERGQSELPAWKEEQNTAHRTVRARVEHAVARMKSWKVLRDCRLKGDGVHHAMSGIARLHNLALAG